MRRTCTAVLCCLAGGAGALVVPAQSMALPGGDVMVCTFSGATTALTDIPGIVVSESQTFGDALDDPLSAVPGNAAGETGVVIETGTYTFSTPPGASAYLGIPTQCLHIDVDGTLTRDPDGRNDTNPSVPARVTANGSYDNVLCSTGTTTGNATLTTPTDGEIASITAAYTIAFVAGTGAGVVAGATVTPQPGNPNPVRSAAGAGVVHIDGKPATSGRTACVDSDAADFNVFGALAVTITS